MPAGFSLVEVLVALAVFGLAVLGLLNLAGENTRAALVVEERVLAGVVADNLGVEAMVLAPEALQAATSGTREAGGHGWDWTRRVGPTGTPGIARVDIAVAPAGVARVAAEAQVFRSLP